MHTFFLYYFSPDEKMIISSSFRKLDVFFHHSSLWKQSGNHVIDMNAGQKQFTNRQLLAGWCFKVLLAIFSVSSSHIYLNITEIMRQDAKGQSLWRQMLMLAQKYPCLCISPQSSLFFYVLEIKCSPFFSCGSCRAPHTHHLTLIFLVSLNARWYSAESLLISTVKMINQKK